ncbi:MAG: hypothetical protein JEZ09_19895 [Salinivirgaceae bacterium]|nr:hypothetical protein [Salinivirgaceae bacterium]
MKAYIASLVNAIVLISFGLWGYYGSESSSMTAFIPVAFGTIFLVLNKGVKNENKLIAHIVVILTLLVVIGLIKPFVGAIQRADSMSIFRVIAMILTSVWAMLTFIKSFKEARKNS